MALSIPSADRPAAIWRYFLYRLTSHTGFHYPIYILFLRANGLSFTAIGAIASIQSVVVVAGEVPTGYIGDRVGRRNSLVIASVLFVLSNAGYLVATDFSGFTFVFVTLSLGHTFVSGSASAWLYDTLDEHDIEDEFTHVSGRASAISNYSQTVAMLAGGALYVVNPLYPFVAGVVLSVVNLASAVTLPKNSRYSTSSGEDDTTAGPAAAEPTTNDAASETDQGNEDEDDQLTILEAIPVVREQVSKRSLRSFIVYMALFGGALTTADIYVQPVAQEALRGSIGPTLDAWDVPEAATLGVLYASFTVVSAVAADYAGDVEDRFGVRAVLMLVPAGMAALYLLPAVVPLLAFPMFFVMRGGFSLVFPIAGRYMNDRIESVGRATVLSVVSMLRAVAGIPFRIGSGAVADAATPLLAVAALGGAFLLGAFVLYRWAPPVRTGARTTTAAN